MTQASDTTVSISVRLTIEQYNAFLSAIAYAQPAATPTAMVRWLILNYIKTWQNPLA